MILGSGIMDMRVPLISTYTAKQSESGLPPQPKLIDEGGRPRSEEIESEGKEADVDGGK
jgi:hypothetical protein